MKYAFGIPPVEAFGLGPLPEDSTAALLKAHILSPITPGQTASSKRRGFQDRRGS
jgi:hypothetical protein